MLIITDKRDLRQSAVNGTKWTTLDTIILTIVQIAQWIVLGRLLSPLEFGLMSMLTVVIGLASAFSDMGISNAIIYKQSDDRIILSSLYWLNVFSGIIIALILCILAPLIVLFYHEPKLMGMILVIAWIVPIVSLGQQYMVLLQKDLQFNYIAIIEIIAAVLGFSVTVTLAVLNKGVYSLIFGQMLTAFIKALLLLIVGFKKWPILLHFSIKDLHDYISFGFYQMGERIINYINFNLDYLIIGAFLGAKELGYYTLAYNIVVQPVNRINPIITRVAFPVLAKVQNDIALLKRGFFRIIEYVSFLNIPLLIGLIACANNLIIIFFGEQWRPSVPILQILAGVGIIRVLSTPNGILMLVKGRVDLDFKFSLIMTALLLPGLYISVRVFGLQGLSIALMALTSIFYMLLYIFPIRILLGNCFKAYFGSITISLIHSSIMFVVVVAEGYILKGVNNYLVLLLQIVSGMLVYLGLVTFFRKKLLEEILRSVFRKTKTV